MSKKIGLKYYFTASTKNLDEDQSRYQKIIAYLESLGCKGQNYVHFSADGTFKKKYESKIKSGEISVYALQISLIDKSDILIADIAKESITVGYQIDYAVRKKIPVLVLINKNNKRNTPVMLTSNHYGLLTVRKYRSVDAIRGIISEFVESVITDKIKFNFFITIPVHNYITKRAEKEKKTKSEMIREIIMNEARENPVEDWISRSSHF